MTELAPGIALDMGCGRVRVYESRDYRVALVYFISDSERRQGADVRGLLVLIRDKTSVQIEIVAHPELLTRTLPLCRRHFDGWFDSLPIGIEEARTSGAKAPTKRREESLP